MVSGRVDKGTGGIGRCERQWEGAKVQRWKGGRERSSLVGEWTRGQGDREETRKTVGKCKCAKVER